MSDEGIQVEQTVHLTRTDFDKLSRDLDALDQCNTSVFFHALQDNKSSWDGFVAALDSRRHQQPRRRQFAPNGPLLQRRFLVSVANVLSAARTYFDATSDLLATTFGKTSGLYEGFQSARNYQYDSTPAYRFCEQLRNAMQHSAKLPLRIEVTRAESGMSHRLVAGRDELLRSTVEWKARVRADIESGPEEIDIAHVLDAYWQCIVSIEHQRVVRQLAYHREALERMLSEFRRAGLPEDRPTMLLRTRPGTNGGDRLIPRFGPLPSVIERYVQLDNEDRLSEVFPRDEGAHGNESEAEAVRVTPEAEGVLRAWLIGGPSEASRFLSGVVRTSQEAADTIAGLVNVAGVAMAQVEAVLGVSALELLESLVSADNPGCNRTEVPGGGMTLGADLDGGE